MHALAHRPDPETPAHRSQGFGGIGHCEPLVPAARGRVVALPLRRARDVPRPSSFELAAAARRHRTLQWQRLLSAAVRGLADLTARGWAAWCERQLARHNQRALRELDDRTLRDLGLSRGELAWLAAELRGRSEP